MTATTLFLLCAQVFLIKTIFAYCPNSGWSAGLPIADGLGWAPGFGYENSLASVPCAATVPFLGACDLLASPASYGGGFVISSASPVSPYGVSVISENAIEGILAAGGELPFLGTVSLEGVLPTSGAGAVSYGCGNGNVGIVSENTSPNAAGLGWPSNGYNYGPVAFNGFGYGTGWAGPVNGCGCGAV
ncbi:unnamed protein product [Parnassius apollo]|uniref:(apollo) hypothetical protein n=1 Tax=Parnassius apollo TaxID=110799 RepID=A0A8S3WFD6_PARAO|nr:unnamed protein product [Parnassius apollo]